MKSLEEHFRDWENDTFGYGYGSGEGHVLGMLKVFLAAVPPQGGYDYEVLEKAVTAPVAWLLINALAHDDMIEYGTSPRFGWLTPQGNALSEFMSARSVEQLEKLTWVGEEYVHCYPDHCNCSDEDCRLRNPFWQRHAVSGSEYGNHGRTD